jgi:hypothetical protein
MLLPTSLPWLGYKYAYSLLCACTTDTAQAQLERSVEAAAAEAAQRSQQQVAAELIEEEKEAAHTLRLLTREHRYNSNLWDAVQYYLLYRNVTARYPYIAALDIEYALTCSALYCIGAY